MSKRRMRKRMMQAWWALFCLALPWQPAMAEPHKDMRELAFAVYGHEAFAEFFCERNQVDCSQPYPRDKPWDKTSLVTLFEPHFSQEKAKYVWLFLGGYESFDRWVVAQPHQRRRHIETRVLKPAAVLAGAWAEYANSELVLEPAASLAYTKGWAKRLMLERGDLQLSSLREEYKGEYAKSILLLWQWLQLEKRWLQQHEAEYRESK